MRLGVGGGNRAIRGGASIGRGGVRGGIGIGPFHVSGGGGGGELLEMLFYLLVFGTLFMIVLFLGALLGPSYMTNERFRSSVLNDMREPFTVERWMANSVIAAAATFTILSVVNGAEEGWGGAVAAGVTWGLGAVIAAIGLAMPTRTEVSHATGFETAPTGTHTLAAGTPASSTNRVGKGDTTGSEQSDEPRLAHRQALQGAADNLKYSSYSRSGLIDQLVHEGFTREQAESGVNAIGL